ncbi:type II and III secretion system protein family protein [Massilia soli]|uniref:Type II and III secretion system protein family protein n=1 Tax=Massilia soli TaxID=2792854 RepID=A0ABS7SRH6_9BURK|nr:type II and III secretion system protein family protein [Massilia soli]MBZ2208549.1 type II and III secretion system protein family protein [Massilia soli]
MRTDCKQAKTTDRLARWLVWACCALAPAVSGASAPAPVAKQAGSAGVTTLAPQVTLAEGKSTVMRLPFPAARLSVGNAKIADVILLNPSEVYMLGKGVGTTNLILWNKANDATIIDIVVNMDTTALHARFAQLLAGEKNLTISAAADTLVLSGEVSDAVKLDQALRLANAYVKSTGSSAGSGDAAGGAEPPQSRVINMMSVAAPQQVMLEVKVAEISKTLVDQLGISMGASRTNGSWTYSFLSNLLSSNPSLLDAFNSGSGNFVTVDAQKRNGLIKVLAEPTIMAISGQEASFLAGGKIFIPVAQTNTNGVPLITLSEKEFGIAVKFTPTVLDGGRINLQVAPEVSDLNKEGVGINATGVSGTAILPSFTTRRATTTVQLFDGQSFAIGGLIKNNVTTNVKAFPVLGEIPVLGALFRSSDFQTDRSELVFIITPHLVKPLPPDYKLPTDSYTEPTRTEFFLGGKQEGKPKTAPVRTGAATPVPPSGFDVN